MKLLRTSTVPESLQTFLKGSVEVLQEKYDLVLLSSPGKELVDMHEKYGVRTIGVPMERHISIFKDIRSLVEFINIFRKEKPDMVHSMTPKAGLLCMMAAWICRVPRRVHTFTGLVWPTSTGVTRRVLMLTDWITCACATHIIPEGRGVMDDLQAHITRKPMRVLGYGNVRGVDMVKFSRRAEVMEKAQGLRRPGFTFLFVGRLVGDKGVNELVEAFLRLNSKYKNTRLLLVGSREANLDPLNIKTLAAIRESDVIEEVGPKCDDELLAYYAASDCFVLPSYREGFPNTVLEAGAMGLPCIVTDINGSREIIENGRNGVVIAPKDLDALFAAMERLLVDAALTAEMSRNARPMIESRFEQSFVRQCLLDFYDEIMIK